VNPGGEPERDETGLPPVEIEIPDDARELDRDVQAYYREQRAARRRRRGLRLRGSLARDGIVLPLLACCLILALITGTLLTVFTATSDQNLTGLPGAGKSPAKPVASGAASTPASPSSGATSSASSAASPSGSTQTGAANGPDSSPGPLPGVLPHTTIAVDGQGPLQVADLTHAMLVLIPARCNCAATVSWLISVAGSAHARTFLIYTSKTSAEVSRLYQRLDGGIRANASLALESDDKLRDSIPPSLPTYGLTAILVGHHASAYFATNITQGRDRTTLTRLLTH
jgi:hypothetical protein